MPPSISSYSLSEVFTSLLAALGYDFHARHHYITTSEVCSSISDHWTWFNHTVQVLVVLPWLSPYSCIHKSPSPHIGVGTGLTIQVNSHLDNVFLKTTRS